MPLFCMCTSLFILEDSKLKKAKYTKRCLHPWLKWSQGQQLATLGSATQQLRKKVKKKFPFIMVNNTLQACLYSLGMPGARLQKCGALQAFCLAWQRTGGRACGCFGIITLPNMSCNVSCRTRILTSTHGVLPEESWHRLCTAAGYIPKHLEIGHPYLIGTAGEFMEAKLNSPNW